MDREDSDPESISEFSQEDENIPLNGDGDGDSETNDGAPSKKKKNNKKDIGAKQSKSLFCAKLMVYFVLIVACLTASTLTYVFTSDQETDDFEKDVSVSEALSRLFSCVLCDESR
jgi:hypothetical protein